MYEDSSNSEEFIQRRNFEKERQERIPIVMKDAAEKYLRYEGKCPEAASLALEATLSQKRCEYITGDPENSHRNTEEQKTAAQRVATDRWAEYEAGVKTCKPENRHEYYGVGDDVNSLVILTFSSVDKRLGDLNRLPAAIEAARAEKTNS